jgi:prepilin-type N-terminal cleavage/methylation domain-containing protein/prepilin-type processing-associated H-X9-DG protein
MNQSNSDRLLQVKFSTRRARGFTLIELLVVIAIIGILASILIPALARSKARAQGVFCVNNTKQLTLAWVMYADDHGGRLAYNLGVEGVNKVSDVDASQMHMNWANNQLDWTLNTDNTNVLKLTDNGLGPYVSKSAGAFRDPADNVLHPDQQGQGWSGRVRSYSMNAMIGDAGEFSASGVNENNPEYMQFFSYGAVARRASDIFVFVDEHPDSIDDGYFVNRAEDHRWHDLPASYHNGAATFSFADGHSEMHRWQAASTKVEPLPYAYTSKYPIEINSKAELRDFYWVISKMSIERYTETPAADPQ